MTSRTGVMGALAAQAATLPDSTQGAISLFAFSVLVLVLMFVAVLLVIAAHRAKRRKQPVREDQSLPDAWREAGKRIEP